MNKFSKMVLVGMVLSTSVQAQGKFIPEGLTWNTTQVQFGPVLNRMGFTFQKRQQDGDLEYTGFYIHQGQRVKTTIVVALDSARKLVGLKYVMATFFDSRQDVNTASDRAAEIWTDITTKFTTKYGEATNLFNEQGAAFWFGEDRNSSVVVTLEGPSDYKPIIVVDYQSERFRHEMDRRKRVATSIF